MTSSPHAGRPIEGQEYLRASFAPSDRLAILVRNRSRAVTLQRIATAEKIFEPSFEQWLHFKNERENFDVYAGMNPLKPVSRTRTKEDILSIRHVYVDLDHDGRKSLAAIQESNLLPLPNYVFSTSPGKFHVIWRVEEVNQEQAESLLRAMARKFGGDPAATDSTRVLRIPGFLNQKYEERFVVKAEQYSGRVHHLIDFKLRIDHADSPYHAVRPAPARTAPPEAGRMSQSEHDWAFAKRALMRGAHPEEVIHQIAEFRSGEKHDPQYYARHTVEKALAQLTGSKSVPEDTSRGAGGQTPSLED